MSDGSPFPRTFAFSFAHNLCLGCAATATAQSGRRAKSAPAPAAASDAGPNTGAIALEQPKPTLQFVVGIEKYDSFSSVSIAAYDGVLRSCSNGSMSLHQ